MDIGFALGYASIVDVTDGSEDVLERQRRLVKAIWPNGISVRDRAILEALPNEHKNNILDRLEAVWRADQGEPLASLAKLAGLKRAAFFNLRKAWSARSLAGLVPNESRSGRKIVATEDDPVRVSARKQLRRTPRARNIDVAKRVVKRDKDILDRNVYLTALQRAERIVQHERRVLGAEPSFLKKAYGCGLVIDMTAISMIIDEEPRSLAVVAMVIEAASGLVLGSSLGRSEDGISLHTGAIYSALEFLRERRADFSATSKLDLTLVLPAGIDADRVEHLLEPFAAVLTVGKAGGLPFGAQTVQTVGPRIGRMALNPRRTLSIDLDAFVERRRATVHSMEQAKAVWTREVERHNADRIEALVIASIVDGNGAADAQLAQLLSFVLRAINDPQSVSSGS